MSPRNPLKRYRGQEMGNREELVETCLQVLQAGKKRELYDLLPYISVVRSPGFFDPLLKLLRSGDPGRKEFAALALGSLGDPRAIDPLSETFQQFCKVRHAAQESLQIAIILALGEIGDERAIGPLLKIYEMETRNPTLKVRRRTWILSALGNLAQQGSMLAVKELTQLMRSKSVDLRAQAVTERAVAYWHRPNELPETVFQQMLLLTQDRVEEVCRAAAASLSDLAHLGCKAAEEHFTAGPGF